MAAAPERLTRLAGALAALAAALRGSGRPWAG